MPTHDVIDNQNEKLFDHINRILSSTGAGRFAVGYFFLSGLTGIAEKLSKVKELRLLIGNTTNRETLEQLAEGYRRLELVAEATEAQSSCLYKRENARQGLHFRLRDSLRRNRKACGSSRERYSYRRVI